MPEQFTLLDINEQSLTTLKKLFKLLELENYIYKIEKADATQWEVPRDKPIDIFISETMQRALRKEPQVAICMNIVPQLPEHAVMIPEQIILSAALINVSKRMQEKLDNILEPNSVFELDTIYTLNKEEILKNSSLHRQNNGGSYLFPKKVVSIPTEIIDDYPTLHILTDIHIYKEERLLIDESQLTMPIKIAELKQDRPSEITFQYRTGEMPEVQFSFEKILV